jgi:hypothetical protein
MSQIHQDNIRFQLTELRYGLVAIFSEPYNSHVRLELKHGSEAIADHGMIFGNKNSYGLRHSGP